MKLLNSKLNELPILKDFSDLKRFEKIYSRKYGFCIVNELYQKDIIICPINQKSNIFELWGYGKKVRISPEDSDVSTIPVSLRLTNIKTKPVGFVDGKEMSFSSMKNIMIETKRIDSVSLIEASDILDMNKKELVSLCNLHNVVIHDIGRKRKIEKIDLLRLNKIVFNKK